MTSRAGALVVAAIVSAVLGVSPATGYRSVAPTAHVAKAQLGQVVLHTHSGPVFTPPPKYWSAAGASGCCLISTGTARAFRAPARGSRLGNRAVQRGSTPARSSASEAADHAPAGGRPVIAHASLRSSRCSRVPPETGVSCGRSRLLPASGRATRGLSIIGATATSASRPTSTCREPSCSQRTQTRPAFARSSPRSWPASHRGRMRAVAPARNRFSAPASPRLTLAASTPAGTP